ncbi:MAG: hypothetical protein AAGD05_04850 [Bacteroidota bacterium]
MNIENLTQQIQEICNQVKYLRLKDAINVEEKFKILNDINLLLKKQNQLLLTRQNILNQKHRSALQTSAHLTVRKATVEAKR